MDELKNSKSAQTFWDNRYQEGTTGWDIGHVSTPIKEYADQLTDKNLRILIPGCGNSHEAEYLFKSGFKNIHLVDLSPTALQNFKKRVPDFPEEQLFCENFFDHQGEYDLIFEQTFFCAIHPKFRSDYAKKMSELIVKGGKLAGLLFNIPFDEDHPPYGGSIDEYKSYFTPYFDIKYMEPASNSIEPRKGEELFVLMVRK